MHHTKSIAELSAALQAGDVTSVELTQAFLDRIAEFDGEINSFITIMADEALADAKAADELRAAGKAGPLTGIPMAHKDIFCTKGTRSSCASKMLDNFVPPYDATVVEKLKAAGMICVGKTNMDEFAMGSSNETSFYGPVNNPWDLTRVPGGSSGGSAAAVAAGLVPATTGTDTGGSIRQPASFCGVTGFKPTYGRVSRWGMIAFASSMDQAGIFTRSAEDAALVMEAMSGFDAKDSTSIDVEVADYQATINDSLDGLTIGLPKEYFSDDLDPAIEKATRDAIAVYESMGATVKEISLPNAPLSIPIYYVMAPAEASSNLSRFDGARFGYRCDQPENLMDMYLRSRTEAFGDEVQRRIMVGSYVLSASHYDAYYVKAQRIRRMIKDDFTKAFEEVDVIASPVAPSTAFTAGEKSDDPIQMYLNDMFTIAVNMAGLPGMSIPAGFIDDLPVGLQLIGKHFDEGKLFNVAHKYQQVTDWHKQTPAKFA